MAKLSDIVNISTVNEKKLIEAGVDTPEKLKELGAKEAFLRMRQKDNTLCINTLYGLAGAVQGIRWHNLPQEEKDALKAFFKSL